ncbi:ATP-binding cassette domain-containing protein [Limnobacter sp.]|uniref:ATP-binding cassette domain-containing protein n=1 Tax=Limnobacter sp. TaxID=2003368 RepID=UPI0035135834
MRSLFASPQAASQDSSVLTLKGVAKTFGGRAVLQGLDFILQAGECVALLGPNGAGKSTTISIALGLDHPTDGQASLLGHVLPAGGHLARAKVGVVPQYDALDPDFTVLENLLVFGRYFGIPKSVLERRASELLEFTSLDGRAKDSVSTLSGGMRRRLVLARALINQPTVLFLDEPTTGLDPQAKHVMWDRLLDLKRQGMAMLLTTHYMDEAQRLADRVAVLDHGKLVDCQPPQALIDGVVGRAVLEVWGAGASTWLCSQGVLESIDRRGDTFYCRLPVAEALLKTLQAQAVPDVTYLYRPGNLEDVYFGLTGKALRDD